MLFEEVKKVVLLNFPEMDPETMKMRMPQYVF